MIINGNSGHATYDDRRDDMFCVTLHYFVGWDYSAGASRWNAVDQTSMKGDAIMRFLKLLALATVPLLSTPAAATGVCQRWFEFQLLDYHRHAESEKLSVSPQFSLKTSPDNYRGEVALV
jgi:hypothetical protein